MEGAGPALLLPCGWRIQSLLAFLQDTQPTNTYFKVKEEEEVGREEEVWGRKGGRPEREKEKETQTDRPTGWQRRSVRDREEEGKKESRWYRRQNEQVIEVKWEREGGEREKGGATWEKSNMGSVQQRYVGKRACYGSPLGLPRQIVCAVSQSVLRSGTAPHGDVWRRQDGIA